MAERRYWVFANKPEDTYGNRIWDMSWILEHRRYTLKKSERKRSRVQVGDIVYLRIYGQAYIGRFVVGGAWQPCPELDVSELPPSNPPGTYEMTDLILWPRPVRQDFVMRDLSNGDVRSRIIEITREDGELIEAVQSGRERLRNRPQGTASVRDPHVKAGDPDEHPRPQAPRATRERRPLREGLRRRNERLNSLRTDDRDTTADRV